MTRLVTLQEYNTEFHYRMKKRKHSLAYRKFFYNRFSSAYEKLGSELKVELHFSIRIWLFIYLYLYGRHPTFHGLMSVRRKKNIHHAKNVSIFLCDSENNEIILGNTNRYHELKQREQMEVNDIISKR